MYGIRRQKNINCSSIVRVLFQSLEPGQRLRKYALNRAWRRPNGTFISEILLIPSKTIRLFCSCAFGDNFSYITQQTQRTIKDEHCHGVGIFVRILLSLTAAAGAGRVVFVHVDQSETRRAHDDADWVLHKCGEACESFQQRRPGARVGQAGTSGGRVVETRADHCRAAGVAVSARALVLQWKMGARKIHCRFEYGVSLARGMNFVYFVDLDEVREDPRIADHAAFTITWLKQALDDSPDRVQRLARTVVSDDDACTFPTTWQGLSFARADRPRQRYQKSQKAKKSSGKNASGSKRRALLGKAKSPPAIDVAKVLAQAQVA